MQLHQCTQNGNKDSVSILCVCTNVPLFSNHRSRGGWPGVTVAATEWSLATLSASWSIFFLARMFFSLLFLWNHFCTAAACTPMMHFGRHTHISAHTHKNLCGSDCTGLVNQQIITGKLITNRILHFNTVTKSVYVNSPEHLALCKVVSVLSHLTCLVGLKLTQVRLCSSFERVRKLSIKPCCGRNNQAKSA